MPRSKEVTNGQSATPTKNAQASNSKQSPSKAEQDDADFDPAVEGLVEDIDDEVTLDEEEALDGNNTAAVAEELDHLKKESEMPIDQLMAQYERMRQEGGSGGDEDDEEEEDDEDDDDDDDDDDEEFDEEEDMDDDDESESD